MAFRLAAHGLVKHSHDIPAGNIKVLPLLYPFRICSTAPYMPVDRLEPTGNNGNEPCLVEPFLVISSLSLEHIGRLARMSVLDTEVDGSNPGSSMFCP